MTKAPESVEKKISGIIIEELANDQMDEKDKTLTPAYREYYKRKVAALGLEKTNNSSIIIFESMNKNQSSAWYKMVGNSTLFYKYYIGPRLRKSPTIRRDADLSHRAKSGVIALNSKEKFIERMDGLGYKKYQESELGLLIFDLGKKFTTAELNEFKKQSRAAADKFNSIITPKENFPDIYARITELIKLTLPKLSHFNPAYRELIGCTMADNITALAATYLRFANGVIQASEAKTKFSYIVMGLRAQLLVISENRILNYDDLARIGGVIADLESVIEKRLR